MSGIGNFIKSFMGGGQPASGPKRTQGSGISVTGDGVTVGENYTGCFDINGQKGCYKNGQIQDSYTPSQADPQLDAQKALKNAARNRSSGSGRDITLNGQDLRSNGDINAGSITINGGSINTKGSINAKSITITGSN